MAGLLGYMLAIVITLGGYLAGLHWLVSPSDPWQANPKLAQSSAQPAKKRVAPPKPAEATAAEAAAAPEPQVAPEPLPPIKPVMEARAEAPAKLASVERPILAESVKPQKPAVQEAVHSERHAALSSQARRDPPAAKPKPIPHRRLAERTEGRRLQLMVLRTYEGPDGRRFSRLLPLSAARQTFAFREFDW